MNDEGRVPIIRKKLIIPLDFFSLGRRSRKGKHIVII